MAYVNTAVTEREQPRQNVLNNLDQIHLEIALFTEIPPRIY